MRSTLLLPVLAAAAAVGLAEGATAQAPLPAPTTIVQFSYVQSGPFTTFRRLQIKNVPAGSTVTARCLTAEDERCGGKLRRAFRRTPAEGTLRIRRFERKRIRGGNRIEIEVSNPAYATQYKVIKLRRRANPTITTTCSRPGSDERGAC